MRIFPAISVGLALASCGGDRDPKIDPGRVTVWRLNRAEYDNTVRDLLGTTQHPADSFPSDDFSLGFSNIADALSISSTHIDLYQIAAESLLDEISSTRLAPITLVRIEAESAEGAGVAFGTVRNLWTPGKIKLIATIPTTGDWTLSVLGSAPVAAPIEVTLDGTSVWTGPFSADVTGVDLPALAAGTHELDVSLTQPGSADDALVPSISLDALELTGPNGLPIAASPGRALVFTCDPAVIGDAPCAEQVIGGFAARAWRRPLNDREFADLMTLYGSARAAGSPWEEAVMSSLEAVLLSPWFLYRVEVDPDPTAEKARPLDGYELATRLSYFLWSSMPDAELESVAAGGGLADPAVIRGEVARMLADPKAAAVVDTLGVEWLYLDRVDEATPDPVKFPDFDEELRASMKEELRLFAGNIILGDRSMMELLTGTDTWIDARLAEHYGMPAPESGFSHVVTSTRPGIVGRAGWLTSLSYPLRTSPVRRGKWVVENLMCEPPAPPPSGVVPQLPQDSDTGITASLRDQLEEHRSNPACASCHVVMDGIGFGLENFDAVGQYRTVDDYGNPIDSTGSLVSGATFSGPVELGDVLSQDPKVSRCMVQKVFTFATGRAPRVEDLVFLEQIDDEFTASGYRFSALAAAIATSDAFRYRTPAGAEAAP